MNVPAGGNLHAKKIAFGIIVTAVLVASAIADPLAPGHSQPTSFTVAAADAVLEGTLEVLIEDSDRGSRILYFLISGGRRVRLRFVAPQPNLTTGTRVRVRGQWAKDGTFVVSVIERF